MPLAAFRFFRRDHAWNTAVRNELLAMSLEGFDQARLLESLQSSDADAYRRRIAAQSTSIVEK